MKQEDFCKTPDCEMKCPVCKIVFSYALWCGVGDCPVTQQRKPTAEQREQYGMDDAPRS